MATLLNRMAIVAALVISAGTSAQTSGGADLIVFNAKVHTVDANKPEATAFAIKHGEFIAVGERRRDQSLEGRSDAHHRCPRPHDHPRPQ
jgi:hypothetical protein